MDTRLIIAIIFAVALVAVAVIVAVIMRRRTTPPPQPVELEKQKIDTLVNYLEQQKAMEEEKLRVKALATAERREKLEVYKRTKDELKDTMRAQLDSRDWIPLQRILQKVDKGNMGVYILFNATRNKYYVGQAKELYTRIKKHFEIEQIARDFLAGDQIHVKTLSANEIIGDYRIDHIEKTGIEIFDSKVSGYNRKEGNL
ncbi:MAG: GIY-YIG nuclease family protein [Firmicutes bacterium]|nr:GIY-YIG nuclease family protein [Bacillota bacterium]